MADDRLLLIGWRRTTTRDRAHTEVILGRAAFRLVLASGISIVILWSALGSVPHPDSFWATLKEWLALVANVL
jgi:hypothetical protein